MRIKCGMSSQTFGQLLGILVRQKRRAMGLTQMQLAEDAFGTSGKTRRVSELESGSVANPHAKTIDPIINILKITQEEIEECARKSTFVPDSDLDRAYREARNLIESIARQFENNDPQASLADIDQFLRAKAAEWSALRERIEAIDASNASIEQLKNKARIALDNGNFKEVDENLKKLEDFYQMEKTLSEIRKHASVRISRGDSALLSGNTDTALYMYDSAIEFFRPFSEYEMANVADELAWRIYETSRRSFTPAFYIAAAILEKIVSLDEVKIDDVKRADCYYRLGLCFRNEYESSRSPRSRLLLDKAIMYSKNAIENIAAKNDALRYMSSAISLANCVGELGKIDKNPEKLKEASDILTSIERDFNTSSHFTQLENHLYNSLGTMFRNLSYLTEDRESIRFNERALDAFTKALFSSERNYDIEVWGVAHLNIGLVLAERAERFASEPEHSSFLRIRAISDLSSAVEAFSSAYFLSRLCIAQSALGKTLFTHAINADDDQIAEIYLLRALQAIETAISALGDNKPIEKAIALSLMANIFFYHSQMAELAVAIQDIEKSIFYVDCAAVIFRENGSLDEFNNCISASENAKNRREALILEASKKQ